MTCVRCDKARAHHDCPLCGSHLCAVCCRMATDEADAELAAVENTERMTDEQIDDAVRYVMNRVWQERAAPARPGEQARD